MQHDILISMSRHIGAVIYAEVAQTIYSTIHGHIFYKTFHV